MFLGLVRQGQKMFAAHQTTGDKTGKTPQKPAKTRESWNLVDLGSFRIFLLFQKSSRFVYPSVVLRFSQKHTCLEQSESFVGLFDLYLLRTTIFSSAVEGRGVFLEAGSHWNPWKSSRMEILRAVQSPQNQKCIWFSVLLSFVPGSDSDPCCPTCCPVILILQGLRMEPSGAADFCALVWWCWGCQDPQLGAGYCHDDKEWWPKVMMVI